MSIAQDIISFVAGYENWAKALIVGGLMIAAVTAVFAPKKAQRPTDGVKPGSYGLTITSPQPDKDVEYHFRVSGTVGQIPENHKLWLMTTNKEHSRFWPQAEIFPNPDGSWVADIGNIGGTPPTKRVFGVYLIPPKGQLLIQLQDRAAAALPNMHLTSQEIESLGEIKELVRRQVNVISKKP